MTYRFVKEDGSVRRGVRRIADEQIRRALAELDDDERDLAETVHRVRKRCKKLRGLLRLVRPAFDDYGPEHRAFSDAARSLSDLRDARSLIGAYDGVAGHFDDRIDRRAFAPIRARLTRDARQVREDPEVGDRMGALRRDLEAARERAATWTLDKKGFDAIAGGLGRTYARARKQMKGARSDPDGETMHEWRKSVKYHWQHARLLSDIAPAMMAPQIAAAGELSELLGDHHDLALLDARLGRAPGDFGAKTDIEAFRALARERREALGSRAFVLARLSFAERPAALAERWRAYWRVWRVDDPASSPLVES